MLVGAPSAASADCTPQAASNIIATCTGATTNQGGGAPGTSAGASGYGAGTETGITVDVAAGAANTVTGIVLGIYIVDGTVTNNLGAGISGGQYGIFTAAGAVNVTNSGSITGTSANSYGIYAATNATVTNNAGGSILGGVYGIRAFNGDADVTNSGSITGTSWYGIYGLTNATMTNKAGGSITGGQVGILVDNGLATVTNSGSISGSDSGIHSLNGAADVTNAGSITGTNSYGIRALTNATVTNNAAGSILGGQSGIAADGVVNVINSGSITGTISYGIYALTNATVTNNAGGTINGGLTGIRADFAAVVTNSGSILGTSWYGIYGWSNATVTNKAGGTITGGQVGILAETGAATVINSGSITGTSLYGISAIMNATVTNNAAGSITGGVYGIRAFNGDATVTNSGSITGTSGAGIYAAANVMVTNTVGGTITSGGSGIFATGGGSSVFNAGTISGGSAAIRFAGTGNTLTLAPGSVITGNVLGTGSDTFQLGGSGAASFDVSQIGAAAQYRGFGAFNKIGSSVWTLSGTSSFAGPVNVNGGTLSVNGNITSASGVTVTAGGTLGGTGTVGNTTINGGTLAPGNSIGTLTVAGSLSLTAASTYLVEVSPTTSDRTNVTGTATLGGATVNANFAAGTYVNRQYTILNATGGVTGTFGTLVNTNLPANFVSSLSYDANNAFLNLTLTLPPQPAFGAGLSINQSKVGTTLINFFNTTGSIPLVFGSLTQAGLTQISGESATGSQQTTFNAMNLFMGVLTDPFIGGRGDSALPGSVATPFAEENDRANAYASQGRKRTASERDAYAMFTKAPPRPVGFEPRWSAWAAGFGGSQTTDGNATLGTNDTTSRLGGVAVGADYRFSPDTIAGFALAGGGTSFGVANGLGSGRSDLFQAGAFVRHTVGRAYISGALAYGWQDVTTDRTVTVAGIDRLRAQFNANAFSGRVEGGHRFVTPWMGITPYAAGQFTTFELPAYAEQAIIGATTFALGYASKSVTATRSELGLRTDKSFAMQDGIFTLRGRAAWAHDYNTDRNIAATFQTLPGASFVVNGARPARDAALATASAEMKWLNGFSLAAAFEGEFSSVTRSYGGKGIARYQW